jgi:hypothetical protein
MAPAPDEASAAAAAQVCGVEVEVEAARTAWNTLYALPDGSRRLDTSIAAVRTDVSGEWAEIDNTVVDGGVGLEVLSPVTEMVFSDGTPGQPLVQLTRDGHTLVFDVPFELREPEIAGPSVTYPQVLTGVDLVVTVNADATGFTEVLRVESPEAAANPALAALAFPIQVSDGLRLGQLNGGFVANDASGEHVFVSPAPTMWDSAAEDVPALADESGWLAQTVEAATGHVEDLVQAATRVVAPVEGDTVAAMPITVRDGLVTVIPDADVLSDPGTVWPVYIDPAITLAEYIAVSSAGWTHYNFANDDGVGRCNSTSMGCSTPLFTERLMWEFHGLEGIGALEPAEVTSAVFRVYGTHSYSCTPAWIQAWRVGEISSATNWSTASWGVLQDSVNVAHKASCGNQRWIEFNVTEGAQAVASVNASTLTEGLKADDESTMAGWKRYRWDAQLSVTYNRAPDTPTNPYTTNSATTGSLGCGTSAAPTYVHTLTPFIRATISDPDRTNVTAWFDVYRNGTLVWDGGQTAAQPSGQQHYRQIPSGKLTEGLAYVWNIFAWDGLRHSVNGRACTIVADLTKPVTPTVAPVVQAGSATYVENAVSGAPGQKGAFRLGPGSSTDVVSYLYSFDSPAPTTPATGVNPTIVFPGGAAGRHYLTVKAVDRAGWESAAARTYVFWVGNPPTTGRWALDDGAGLSAADAIAGYPALTLSGSTTWGDGARVDVLGLPDGALVFDGPGDVATSPGPVAATNGAYSVMAFVRLDDLSVPRTAVSQDGATASGFELGYRTSGCPAGMAGCWAFTVNTVDGAAPAPVVLASQVPVRQGWWVQLTAVRDTASGAGRLYVCDIGDGVDTGDGAPVLTSGTAPGVTWNAAGSLRLGQGRVGAAAANPWLGSISGVQVWAGPIDGDEAMRVQAACENAEIPALLPEP